jgi:hypothetical protein
MFELIVLGLILAGLAAIARAPADKQRTDNPTQPAPMPWSARTDWHRFHKPTYLRRGIVLDGAANPSNPARGRRSPVRDEPSLTLTGEAP